MGGCIEIIRTILSAWSHQSVKDMEREETAIEGL